MNQLLASHGLLKVSGIEAKKLLQGQLTCDIEKITPNQSLFGAHCNPQGRILSFFRISLQEGDYYLQMPRALVPIALKALQKYAVFYKVALSDASDSPNPALPTIDLYQDILANIPAIYPETSEKFLPHDLNLHLIDAISFTKGCYTGQEIIARMQYLGKSKNQLQRIQLQLDLPPERGSDLDYQGQVVDYYKVDNNTYEVLLLTQVTRAKT